MRDRRLAWDGCLNVRDLGGHATDDGGETAWRRVVRADNVRGLTDAGWRALADYGVRTVVDLRSFAELAQDPPRELELDVVHVPVHPDAESHAWREIEQAIAGCEPDRELELFYLEAVRRWGGRLAEAVAAAAEAPAGGVVVHCQGGRDRTGMVAALLLRHAGVPVADVAADYALSSACLEPSWRPWVDAADDEEERARRLRQADTPAEAMRATLAAVEAEHGSVAGFLGAHGVAAATIARARDRLRG